MFSFYLPNAALRGNKKEYYLINYKDLTINTHK